MFVKLCRNINASERVRLHCRMSKIESMIANDMVKCHDWSGSTVEMVGERAYCDLLLDYDLEEEIDLDDVIQDSIDWFEWLFDIDLDEDYKCGWYYTINWCILNLLRANGFLAEASGIGWATFDILE